MLRVAAVRIRLNGSELVTSQLVFDAALDDEIVASQELYASRGERDTLNTNDNVVSGESDLSKYTFETARMSDGALLAWKTLVVRSSTTDALCSIQGAGGAMAEAPRNAAWCNAARLVKIPSG